jgi:hypothetical protein
LQTVRLKRNKSVAFLRAAGIDNTMRGETLRKTHGLTLDGLGAAEIFVSEADEDRAKTLLTSAEAGEFRLPRELASD